MYVINWNRNTDYVLKNFNHVTLIGEGEGWMEERTGLHENEFIETRRHRFSVPVLHHTNNSVNVFQSIGRRGYCRKGPVLIHSSHL